MLVSIIVPVYNAEPFLSKCVISLLNQTHRDIEIILINDGSTDKSLNICKHFASLDKRVKIKDQQNQGQSVARNLGINISKGEYIMFVDADDFCEPDIVSSLVATIKPKQIGLAICSYTSHLFDNDVELRSNCLKIEPGQKAVNDIFDLRTLDISNQRAKNSRNYEVSMIWGRLYTAEVIKKNNLQFNPLLSKFEDTEFNMVYLSHVENIFVLDRNLYHYHVGTAQGTQTISDKITTDLSEMINNSYKNIYKAFLGGRMDYLNFFYSYIFIGYLIRLFQVGSPVTFREALSEVKKVSKSEIFKNCMNYYYRPNDGSQLFPFFLKVNLFFPAALVAKIRLLKVFYSNKPIRQWCFSKDGKN